MRTHKMTGAVLLVLSFFLFSGCADNPGKWGADKVSAKVSESLELSDVTITASDGGGFTGSGTRSDGETVTFTITQDAEAHRMSWDAKGDRGFVEDGYYELK